MSNTRTIIFKVARLVGKGMFFFFIGIFIFEVFLDLNPSRILVSGTSFSISFYVYITLFDLIHFFWQGLLALGVGAVLFAFSKYRYIPFALLLFGLAFYNQIIQSASLMQYYEMTYACHEIVNSKGYFVDYVCPLISMLGGHPTIPLQGSVLAPMSLAISLASFAIWRLGVGLKIALTEMVILGSAVVSIYEVLIFEYQRHWFLKQVTDYQKLVYLGNMTNQELLTIGITTFVVFAGLRAFLLFHHRRSRRDNEITVSPTVNDDYGKTISPEISSANLMKRNTEQATNEGS